MRHKWSRFVIVERDLIPYESRPPDGKFKSSGTPDGSTCSTCTCRHHYCPVQCQYSSPSQHLTSSSYV